MLKKIASAFLVWTASGLTLAHPGIHEQVDVLNEQLKKQPTYRMYAQRAHLNFEGGHIELALKDLNTAAKMGPKEPLLFEFGNIALVKGEYAKALKYFNQFIQFNNKYPEVYQARAKALQKMGRTQEAIQDIKHSFQLQQAPHPGLYIEAANLIYSKKTNHLQPAIDLLDEGIARLGVQGQLQERAIDLLLENKRPAMAAERMLRLGTERNHNVFWRSDYAALLLKTGRQNDAQNEFTRALQETKGMDSAAVSELKVKITQQLAQFK